MEEVDLEAAAPKLWLGDVPLSWSQHTWEPCPPPSSATCKRALDSHLPVELQDACASFLDAASLCRLALSGSEVHRVCQRDHLWRGLAEQLPCVMNGLSCAVLAQICTSFSPTRVQEAQMRLLPRHRSKVEASASWRSIFLAALAAEDVLVVDVGNGYTKFGLGSHRTPRQLQLCSSPTHPADAARETQIPTLLQIAGKEQNQAGRKQVQALLVGEPFKLSAGRGDLACWQDKFLQPQLLPQRGKLSCFSVPQALLALWAHGHVQDGLVLNIGQKDSVVTACLQGELCRQSTIISPGVGGALLTNFLLDRLLQRGQTLRSSGLTWCRDIKEQHCEVAPFALAGASEEDLQQLAPVKRMTYHGVSFELGAERFLVPEILFAQGKRGLPGLIFESLDLVLRQTSGMEERYRTCKKLLGAVVLTGGTAALRGLSSRLQKELQGELASFLRRHGLQGAHFEEIQVQVLCNGSSGVYAGGRLAAVALCSNATTSKQAAFGSAIQDPFKVSGAAKADNLDTGCDVLDITRDSGHLVSRPSVIVLIGISIVFLCLMVGILIIASWND